MSSIPSSVQPASTAKITAEAAQQQIATHVRQAAKFIRALDIMVLMSGWLVLILATWLVGSVIDHWLVALPMLARWSIWLAVVALSTWYAATRLTPLLVRRINPTYAAQRIEQIVPEFKNGLIAWFELQSMPDHGVPKGVMAALSYRAMRFIGGYDPSSTIDSGPLIKRAGLIVLLVIGLSVYGALSPKSILESGMRLAMPWLNTAAPTRVQILEVSPGSTELTYGVPLDVTADLKGLRNNEPVMVCYNTLDGQFSNIRTPLTASIEGFQFKGAVKTGTNGVEHDMEYWIEAGDAVSRKYRVTLSPLPSLAVDRVLVEFPKYTRLQPRDFSPTVDIEAVEGSKMDVWGSSNQQLSRARLVTNAQLNEAGQIYQAGEYLEMTVDGQTVQGSCWLFPSKQSFCLSGANVRGDSNIYPVSRPLKISADLPPEIELVGPEDRVVKVAPTSRLTLEIRASDPDYGLTKVVLNLRQNQIPSTTRVLLEGADEGKDPTLARVFPVPLNLADLKASPGDRIEIIATAFDNRHDPNSKTLSPNQTKSIPLILEVVAPAEAKVPPELQRKEPEKNQPNSKDPNKQSEQPQKDSTSDKQDGSESGNSQGSDSKSGKSESGNSESPANDNNPNGSKDDKSNANDPSNNGKESGSQESSSSNSGNNEPGNDDSGNQDSGNKESGSNESGSKESNSGESGKKSSGGNKSGNQASDKQESGKQESGNQNSGDQNGSSKESSSSPENSSKQGGKQGGQKIANQSGNSKSADSANGESSRNGSKKNSSNDKSNSQPANGDSSNSNSNDLSDPSQSNDPSEARQRESDKRAADRVKEFMEKQKSSDKGSQQGSKDGTPQGSKDGTNADNARNNDSPKGSDQKGDGQKGDGQKGDGQKGDGQKGDGQKGEQPKGAGQESSNNQPKGDSGNSGDNKQSDANGSKPAGEDSKGSKDPSKSGQPADGSKPENKSADGKQEGKPDGKSEGSQPKPDAGSGNKQGNDPNKGSQSKSGNSDNSQKGNDQNGNDQNGKSDQSGSKSDQSESPGQSQSDSEKKDSNKGQSGKDERIQRDGGQGDGGQGDGGQGSKSGDKQDANSKSDGSSKSQSSGSQGSDSSKSQPQQGEGKQADNKQGDNKQADGKQGGGKQGDAKSGKSGESSKQDSKSGQQGANSKSSESQSAGSKSSGSEGAESGSEGSQGSEGSPSGGSKPNGQGSGKPSNGKEASQGGGGATSGGAGGAPGATEASNPNDAKKATDLVLDYLKRQRQQPDPELLKEMNWTEQDLRNFVDRYQRARDLTASAEALENSASELSRLRGDGKNASVGASGAADAYRNQIDAGGPQRPPENLRKRVEAFQEALKKSQK